jgi:hypothetical protein
MKLFWGNKITGGTASRAEVYGLFVAAIILVGGGGAYAVSNLTDTTDPPSSALDCRSLPELPSDSSGTPVGSIELRSDPTGGKNFEQFIGMDLIDLSCKIGEAHDWGDTYLFTFTVNGEKTLSWYSNRVDIEIVRSVLTSIYESNSSQSEESGAEGSQPEESGTEGAQPGVTASPSAQPGGSVTPEIDCLALPNLPHSGTPIYGGTAQVLQGETYIPPAGYGAIRSGTTSGSNIPTYDNYTWGPELTGGLSGTGLNLTELSCKIAEAHGYWGNQYSLGLGLSGDTILHIYNSEVDLGILDQVLRSVGAR